MTQVNSQFDAVILGQGIAGTALAWSLTWRGLRVLIVDRDGPSTSSKIAAGLMTPITGQAMASAWRYETLWTAAVSFYERVEQQLGRRFFHQTQMVRLFDSQQDVNLFERRCADSAFNNVVSSTPFHVNSNWFVGELGGFEMMSAGRLDVSSYLNASREFFHARGSMQIEDLNLITDLEVSSVGVHLPKSGVSASQLIFCQGVDAQSNPWFNDVAFKPAKGEILTLHIPGLKETRVVHRGVWLVPVGSSLFKVGATYDWEHLNNEPTVGGRHELEFKLKQFLRLPYEVVHHEAAVRPIHRNQFPVLGLHPVHRQLGIFNGLGSKGSLHAPYFALMLSDHLTSGRSIESDVNVVSKTRWKTLENTATFDLNLFESSSQAFEQRQRKPLTQLAQDAVRNVIRPGDTVIDATAGNGHDTHFLAEAVGENGTVFAFDIQSQAIEKTSKRLNDAGWKNVTMFEVDHAQMSVWVPSECSGKIKAIMFNLGYLPGGDKQIKTRGESTVTAITAGTSLLNAGGILTIIAYTGHEGGADEAKEAADLLDGFSKSEFNVTRVDSQPGKGGSPVLFLVSRRTGEQ